MIILYKTRDVFKCLSYCDCIKLYILYVSKMNVVTEKICSYNSQGIIECIERDVSYTTVDKFERKGNQIFDKERKNIGYPLLATESQVKGQEQNKWIAYQTDFTLPKDPDRDIISPPNDIYTIDWKRYQKPLYPFGSEPEWGEDPISYSIIHKNNKELSNNTNTTWISNAPKCNKFTSSQWKEELFEENTITTNFNK